MLPIPLKTCVRQGGRSGGIIEHSNGDVVTQGRLQLVNDGFEALLELRQGQLGAENQVGVAPGAIPKQNIEFVVQETRERAFAFLADKLPELRLRGSELGILLGRIVVSVLAC